MSADIDFFAHIQVWLAAYTIITTVSVHLGYGSHASVVQQKGGQDLLEQVLLINFGPDFSFGIVGFSTPKFAVVALLSRILNPGRIHRIFLWFLASLVFVASVICIIVILTNCDPHKALWQTHLMAEGATCRDPWIMVSYCIFAGGMLICILAGLLKLTRFSPICLRRPVPCRLPDFRISETSIVFEEEDPSKRSVRTGRLVSAGI